MVASTRGRPRSFDRGVALDKAMRLFWRQGYEATSVRDLTDELGIGAPSLYSAFGDKQQLFGEAVDAYGEHFGGLIDRALADEPTARTAVERMLREAARAYTRTDLPHGCLVIHGDAGTSNAEVTKLLSGIRATKTAAIAVKIRTDVAAGVLAADTDADALARFTYTVLLGMSQSARDGATRFELEQVVDLALRTWPPTTQPAAAATAPPTASSR